MITPTTHILPLATIRRRRVLPAEGTVLVRGGQKVSPTDVIAEANLNPQHIVLDVTRGLGVTPSQAVQYIQRRIGEEVSEEAIIASRGGVAARVIRAPMAGRLVAVSGGQVLMEVSNQPYRLKAGLPGEVFQVEPDQGAVIEAIGAWVQGVWGNGEINYGELHVLAKKPDHELSPNEVHVSLRGSMILAGHCGQQQGLERGADAQIRGLILGTLATHLIPVAAKMPYPIVVIDGFGRQAMNSTAHVILSTNESREVTINAEPYDRFTGQRPEVIIPLPASNRPPVPPDILSFAPRQKVRLVGAPRAGASATITNLQPGLTSFPSGLRAPAAQVEFEDGEKAAVPLANIEVLG